MRRHRPRQSLHRLGQPAQLLLAEVAPHQMALEHLRLERGQRSQRVRADALGLLRVDLVRTHAVTPASSRLNLSSPSRILPFTVPTGSSSISAIWLWVKPPK